MDKYIAGVVGAVGAVVSFAVDGLGMAVTVLIVMMALDYATGLMAGIVTKSLNSRIGFNGIIRKVYYLMLVAAVYAISLVIPGVGFAGDGLAVALCALELISITENGTKIGLPIPKYLQNILLIVKDKTGEGDKKND